MVTRLLSLSAALASALMSMHEGSSAVLIWTLSPAGGDAVLRRHQLSLSGHLVSSSSYPIAGLHASPGLSSGMSDPPAAFGPAAVSAAVSGDGRSLACQMWGPPSQLTLCDIATGTIKRVWALPGHGRVMRVTWSRADVRVVRSVASGEKALYEVLCFAPATASPRTVLRSSRLRAADKDGATYARAVDRASRDLEGLPIRLLVTPSWGGHVGTFLGGTYGTPAGCVAPDSPYSALRGYVYDVSDVQCIVVRRAHATVGRIPLDRGERATGLRFRGRMLLVSYSLGSDGFTDVWSLAPLRKTCALPGALVVDGRE
ncbi:MAG: hypothetical protein FJX72_10980 [Armatimonadetes bacterium]|nr:hypothetical protein [Armatimonadota bacterium]